MRSSTAIALALPAALLACALARHDDEDVSATTNTTAAVEEEVRNETLDYQLGPAEHIATRAFNFRCREGEVHVITGGVCASACTMDANCAAVGGVCNGIGAVTLGDGVANASYCVPRARRRF